MKRTFQNKNFFIGRNLPAPHDKLSITKYIEGGGNSLVYLAENKEAAQQFACKIIPKDNVSPDWEQEVFKSNYLRSNYAVRVLWNGEWNVGSFSGLYFLSEYIEGESLDKLLRAKTKERIDIPFVRKFLADTLTFLHEMQKANVIHGDLHCGNILAQITKDIYGNDILTFRMIDFGTVLLTSDFVVKDDYEQTAINLRRLLEAIDYQKTLDSKSKYIYNFLNDFFIKALSDTDTSRNKYAKRPVELYRLLDSLDDKYIEASNKNKRVELFSPFDFLSCEQIDSHSILNALYSSLFLGLDEIENRSNIVLTGPRGCGKSTVFKCLSIHHRILSEDAIPAKIKYIGVYYRCDDLWCRFQRYKFPENEKDFDIPTIYVSATLIASLLFDLQAWLRIYDNEDFEKRQSIVVTKISDILQINNLFSFDDVVSYLQRIKQSALKQYRFHNNPNWVDENHFPITIVPEICNILCETFSILHDRPIYFFIDDYSSPKVSLQLQQNLNRIFMQRTPNCFFKLSTESPVSFSREDIDGKKYVESREYKLVNLAITFLSADEKTVLSFIDDIFRRRFAAVDNYPVKNLLPLLGSNDESQDSLAETIRTRGQCDTWGIETLGRLCSGDIFYIIALVEKMVTLKGGASNLVGPEPYIPAHIQKKAIREEAGIFLKNLEAATDKGKEVVAVVNAFGEIANHYLKTRTSKNEGRKKIHQASRIEPLERLQLSDVANTIYIELLRYSLFFLDYRGKSQRGDIVPRLHLRRCLIPFFNLTFSKRDSVRVNNAHLNLLLTQPDDFRKKITNIATQNSGDIDLFNYMDVAKE